MYCGSTRSMTKDHIVPLSIMSSRRRKGGEHRSGEVVDACSTCNAILGNRYLLSKAKRSMYLVDQYANRLL
ncbi:HNH endonuclease [Azospirillum oleiclasticum]